ncbi:hypothetical protein ONZ45_g11693 [Pleurotus djamor]|nr:hypothetical protein ONZ45_g11693 [Pleurotus djamor]
MRSGSNYEQTKVSEMLLTRALRGMVNLESFTWDRWGPVTAAGDELGTPEDVWTALTSHSQVRKLTRLLKGRGQSLRTRNRNEGIQGEIDVEGAYRLQVKISALRSLLVSCTSLQDITLGVLDRTFREQIFIGITSAVDLVNWPHIKYMELLNVTVNGSVMANFLNQHPTLVTLKAYMTTYDDTVPFRIHGVPKTMKLLPNIEEINLPSKTLSTLLPHLAFSEPSRIRSLRHICTDDWCSKPYLRLAEMTNLTELHVKSLAELSQLEILIQLTPQLDVFHVGYVVRGSEYCSLTSVYL